jgi:transposase InsO family protein
MCRVFGVSSSGYYAWIKREPSARAIEDARLTAQIRVFHARSKGAYGAPNIHADLRDEGLRVGKKRVARLMKADGLRGVCRRKWVTTTTRDADAQPFADLVQREFAADAPNKLWVADITYIPTWAGFLYLAVVLDAFSRRIVGWAMAEHLRTELVLSALNMALGQRRAKGVVHHSDHGTQYTSIAFGLRCQEARVRAFDGKRGRCLRQRHVRELLRDTRMRAARSPALRDQGRGTHGDLRVHRRLVQPDAASLGPRANLARRVRTPSFNEPRARGYPQARVLVCV